MKSLTWNQVNAWRLSQHCLSARLERHNFVDAVTRTGGIQSQVLSAAELAIGARVHDLSRADIQKALWQDHTLIKTWAMRGTLHLLPTSELPLYVAAREHYDNRKWSEYFAYFGIPAEQYDAFVAAVPQVLGTEPMTREQFASAVSEFVGIPKLQEIILNANWGSPLKPSAFRGDLCFGPSQGQNVTFVNPKKWMGDWQAIEPETAMKVITRRYLEAYGPATFQDFSWWWWGGGGVTSAKKAFKSLGDEIEEVEVEGHKAWALRDTLEAMQHPEPPDTLHMLPLFDAYTLGLGRNNEVLLPKNHKGKVFRPQGWISAVVLVNGYVKGVWEHKTQRTQTTVKIKLFAAHTKSIQRGIEAEAERFGAFLGTRMEIVYE